MTVKELIEALSKYPKDREVRIYSDGLWKSVKEMLTITHTTVDFNHIKSKDFVGIH